MEWSTANPRSMPWTGENDPYKIWLSEIILQQTRVEQAAPYYYRLINDFPDLTSLAKTPLENLLKIWEGLGYYSRARNLHKSAEFLYLEKMEIFPHLMRRFVPLRASETIQQQLFLHSLSAFQKLYWMVMLSGFWQEFLGLKLILMNPSGKVFPKPCRQAA